MIPYTLTPRGISVLVNNRPRIIANDHLNYDKVLAAIKANDVASLKELVDIPAFIATHTFGMVQISEDREVMYNGQIMANVMTERMLKLLEMGQDPSPIAAFMENVFQNPLESAQNELFIWLEKGSMPITEDGCFIAFKKVRDDYMSCHDGKTPNYVGTTVALSSREDADPDRNRTCSNGLHFCSYEYLKSFGGQRTLILKVNPADVVSIPNDYDHTKGRAWKYDIIGEVPQSETYDDLRVKPVVTEEDKFDHNSENWAPAPKKAKTTDSGHNAKVTVTATERFEIDGKKLTAKQLLKKLGTKSVNEAARQWGVARSTLQGWLKKARNA